MAVIRQKSSPEVLVEQGCHPDFLQIALLYIVMMAGDYGLLNVI